MSCLRGVLHPVGFHEDVHPEAARLGVVVRIGLVRERCVVVACELVGTIQIAAAEGRRVGWQIP